MLVMCSFLAKIDKFKSGTLVYKLAFLTQKVGSRCNFISWFFLVVNSRTDNVVEFFKKVRRLGCVLTRKKFVGVFVQTSFVISSSCRGGYLSLNLNNLNDVFSFFDLFYKQRAELAYGLRTSFFFYKQSFFFFLHSTDLEEFKCKIIEPLKINKFPQVLHGHFMYFSIKFWEFVHQCVVRLFSQICCYEHILNTRK